MSEIYCGGGINWTWYLHMSIDSDGFAVIEKEYRLHNFDDWQGASKHPAKESIVGSYRVKENSLDDSRLNGRIAIGIEINRKGTTEYKVIPLRKPVERFSLTR